MDGFSACMWMSRRADTSRGLWGNRQLGPKASAALRRSILSGEEAMCVTCGCLVSGQPAPEDGTYSCVECGKVGKSELVTVKKGDSMPSCATCLGTKIHWVKVSRPD